MGRKIFQSASTSNDFISKLLANLRSDVETFDVKFTFDASDMSAKKSSPRVITAHKIILAGGSSVFRSMFYGALKETEDVRITDFSYDGFSEFINLFYSTDPVLSKENIFEVTRAVDKYDVCDCLPICEQLLMDTMDKNNVCDVLEVAIKIGLQKSVSNRAKKLIEENTEHVFESNGFRLCEKEVLKAILQMDTMKCVDESAVCNAAMVWADNRCHENGLAATVPNKRAELGECFPLIRFLAMDIKIFLELQELYPGVFTHDEFEEMVQYKIRAQPRKLLAQFSINARKFIAKKEVEFNATNYSEFLNRLNNASPS